MRRGEPHGVIDASVDGLCIVAMDGLLDAAPLFSNPLPNGLARRFLGSAHRKDERLEGAANISARARSGASYKPSTATTVFEPAPNLLKVK